MTKLRLSAKLRIKKRLFGVRVYVLTCVAAAVEVIATERQPNLRVQTRLTLA